VAIARDNARINRVGGAVEVIHATGLRAPPFRARGPYRLIFANILLEPLRGLATPIARLVAPRGQVVLSGLFTADADAALACYRARGLALVRRIRLDSWTTLVLMRRAARRSMRRARSRG
jgi:ribosomal protein L11 methyltransferase